MAPEHAELNQDGVPTGFDRRDALFGIANNRINQISATQTFVSDATQAWIKEAKECLEKLAPTDNDAKKQWEDALRWHWMSAVLNFFAYCQDEKNQSAELKAAIKHLETATAMEQHAEMYSMLSQCYRLDGNDAEADRNLATAKQLDPEVFVADTTERSAVRNLQRTNEKIACNF